MKKSVVLIFFIVTVIHSSKLLFGMEFSLDGYFRVRGRLFETLSLDRESQYAEGTRNYFESSFKANPVFRINEKVSLHSRIDLFDLTLWGNNPVTYTSTDPLTEWEPFSQSQDWEGSSTDMIKIRRLWGEVLTDAGIFKIGRMPDHWGLGIYANDGNDTNSDYGDSVDRLLFSTRLGPIYSVAGYEINGEHALNSTLDDTQSGLLILEYRGELNSLGIYGKYRNNAEYNLNLWLLDIWGKAIIGPLKTELEALYLAGEGLIDEEESIIAQYGGVLKIDADIKNIGIGLELGLASGDEDPTNSTYAAYSFDRDYRPTFIIFRQAIPVFKSKDSSNDIDYSYTITGEGISNVFYMLPNFEYIILDNLSAKSSLFYGWVLKTNIDLNNGSDYGYELDLDIKWRVSRAVELGLLNAFFFPGSVYSNYNDFCYGIEFRSIFNF